LSTFTIGLNDKSDAWQQYGEFNKTTGTFDFCPNKFIEPLKDRMIFQIQFQEMMAHTVSREQCQDIIFKNCLPF